MAWFLKVSVVVTALLLIGGCAQPTTTDSTASEASDHSRIAYCNWIVISGTLADEISHLPELPKCAFPTQSTDKDEAQFQAADLSQLTDPYAPSDAKGIYLVVLVLKPGTTNDPVDQATFAQQVGAPVRPVTAGPETQPSTREIDVSSVYTSYDKVLNMTTIYVTATRSSAGKRKLFIYFFRELKGQLTDHEISDVAHRIIAADLPLIQSLN